MADLLRWNGFLPRTSPPRNRLVKFFCEYQCFLTIAELALLISWNFVFFVNHLDDFLLSAHAITTCIAASVVLVIDIAIAMQRSEMEDLLADMDRFFAER